LTSAERRQRTPSTAPETLRAGIDIRIGVPAGQMRAQNVIEPVIMHDRGDAGAPAGLIPTDRMAFARRVGIALDPSGHKRSSPDEPCLTHGRISTGKRRECLRR
jgi:hypothetical protein